MAEELDPISHALGKIEGSLVSLQQTVDRQSRAIDQLTEQVQGLEQAHALTAQTLAGMTEPVSSLTALRSRLGGVVLVLAILWGLVSALINPAMHLFGHTP